MMLIMQNTNENVDQLFPWLGLSSYSEQHSESFWGRSVEAEQLFYEIYDNRRQQPCKPRLLRRASAVHKRGHPHQCDFRLFKHIFQAFRGGKASECLRLL